MKTKFLLVIMGAALTGFFTHANAQANTTLSNLTSPTAVNVTLLPGLDNIRDMGSGTKSWKDLYLKGSIYLGGARFVAYKTGTGTDNTAIGVSALQANTSGGSNTASGSFALYSNTKGGGNTANGFRALYSSINGFDNIAMGEDALYHNTSGSSNIAIGRFALYSNTNGQDNTANGDAALNFNSTGWENTADGSLTLYSNTSGGQNTAIGKAALYNNNGSGNSALGLDAGFNVSSGSLNTFIGYLSNCGALGKLTNSTAIGYNASVTTNNKVVVGNTAITSIGGYVNWSNFSDGRYKQNIKQDVPGLEFINKLNPVTYTLNVSAIDGKLYEMQGSPRGRDGKFLPNPMDDPVTQQAAIEKSKIVYTGFIAQDVEKAAQSLNYDFSGIDKPKDDEQSFYGLRYGDFVVPLVKAVQELSAQNDELKKEIAELKAVVLSGSAASPASAKQQTINIPAASLEQNIPNPFNQSTTINYRLPEQFLSAKIIVTDKIGKTLKQINVSGSGKGVITIDRAMLPSGAYQYTLIVDGKTIATKQMVLLR